MHGQAVSNPYRWLILAQLCIVNIKLSCLGRALFEVSAIKTSIRTWQNWRQRPACSKR